MPTTINTVTEMLFQSTSTINRLYYQIAANSKYIYIQKPGIYFIIAKVGACLATDATAGTNSVIQWGISYDDSRAESLYINVPNSYVYTVHTNVNSMNDSTMLCAMFNVTSIYGTYFRLTAKKILGTTPLMIDNDLTSLTIMSIPGTSYYEGNATTTSTLTKSVYTSIALGNDRIIQYPFVHTLASPNVTVSQPGYVLYVGKTTFNKTAGTDISIGGGTLA